METQTVTAEGMQPRKYLFDLTFDNGQNKKPLEREKPKPTFTQEQLDAEKKASYEQGLQEGQRLMAEDQQQYLNTLLSKIEQTLAHVMAESADVWQHQMAQMQDLAIVIMRKIMPGYVEAYGLAEIEAIVTKVLGEVGREPRLVFRINEALFDTINDKINAIAKQQAYAGKVVVLGDPLLGTSDCRIEWADGGIERNVQMLWTAIEQIVGELNDSDPVATTTASDETLTEPQIGTTDLPLQDQPKTDAGESQ